MRCTESHHTQAEEYPVSAVHVDHTTEPH